MTTLMGHTGTVTSIAFSPDGLMLASGGGHRDNTRHSDNTIRLWEAEDNFRVAVTTLTGHEYGVTSVTFSPDGRTLAVKKMYDRVEPAIREHKAIQRS